MTRILVVGAGATGGWYGARLAGAGRDVTFLVRPRRARELAEGGLRLVERDEETVLAPSLITADRLDGPYDVVLLAVKAAALEAALDDMAPAVGPDTVVVPFLNGLAHVDAVERRFPGSALGGVVKVMTQLGPGGEIIRLGPLATMTVGELDGTSTARLERLREVLEVPDFDLAVSGDILGEMWQKWVFISTMAATTCLMRGTIGQIVAVPGGAEFAASVLAEAAAVAAAAGHPLPEQALAGVKATATQAGSPFAPSMYRDLTGGLPVEVEHVLADLAARGRTFGLSTPLLDLAVMNVRIHNAAVKAGASAG